MKKSKKITSSKLEIGAGNSRQYKDSISMDFYHPGADVKHDINKIPYPFDDNRFDTISMLNILEHCKIEKTEDILREVARIAKPGGEIIIEVPHASSIVNRFAHSQHNEKGFVYWSLNGDYDPQPEGWYNKGRNWKVKKVTILFGRLHRIFGIQWLFNKMPIVYEHFFYGLFPARNIRYVLIKQK